MENQSRRNSGMVAEGIVGEQDRDINKIIFSEPALSRFFGKSKINSINYNPKKKQPHNRLF